MKDILIGALRREKIAETALHKSEAEIERIDILVSLALLLQGQINFML